MKEWIEGAVSALKLPLQVMIGLTIAFGVLLVLDQYQILELKQFGAYTKPLVVICLVMAGCLSLSGVMIALVQRIDVGKKHTILTKRRKVRAKEQAEEEKKYHSTVLKNLDYLSPQELRLLAQCIRNNTNAFNTYVHSPFASTMVSKGLIYTPGGTHHQDHYPFIVVDFVWEAILERKAELFEKDDENLAAEKKAKKRGAGLGRGGI